MQLQTNHNCAATWKLTTYFASQVDHLWEHVVTYSSPVSPHQQTTVANYPFHGSRGGRRTISRFMSDENRVFMVASPKTKTETKTLMFQDQDRDSRVSRPRPRLRFQDQDETKTCKNGSRDQDSSLENSKSGLHTCLRGVFTCATLCCRIQVVHWQQLLLWFH